MRRLVMVVAVVMAVAACAGVQAESAGPRSVVNAGSTSSDASTSTTALATVAPTTSVPTTTVVLATTSTTSFTTTAAPTTTTTTAAPTTTTTTTAAPTTTTTAAPTTTTTTTTTTTAAPVSGKVIFATNCVVCHGANGEGGYGANLQLSSLTRKQIIETVTYGRGGMEPWVDVLTAAEIEAVAKYVKRLRIDTP